MKREEFNQKIRENNIPDSWYHIFDENNPYQTIGDSFILHKNYTTFEFYVIDERGGKNCYKAFGNAEEAYGHLWNEILYQLTFHKKHSIKLIS